jgi:hypothetical protein
MPRRGYRTQPRVSTLGTQNKWFALKGREMRLRDEPRNYCGAEVPMETCSNWPPCQDLRSGAPCQRTALWVVGPPGLKPIWGQELTQFSKIPNFFTEHRSNIVTSSGKVPETWRRNVHAVSAFEIQPGGYFLHELAHFDHLNPSFLLSPSEIRTVFRNGKSKVKVANGIGIPDA